jgi:glycerophosphoryl diester phosphodiesterase
VQGFSAVRRNRDGTYWVMSDNGYGAKNNSADFLLRLHLIRPNFKTADGGTGGIRYLRSITLRDPNHKIPFPIVADQANYPNAVPGDPTATIPVDPSIKAGRLLTGSDFDIESFRVTPDGTIWFGDEFGPFLLHTDATGRVLEAPIPIPGVQSPDNPNLGSGTPNLARSKGIEGMALNTSGTKLYPSLEGALTTDADPRRRIIYEFDLATRQFTGNTFNLHMEDAGNSIGDPTAVNDDQFLVIERDNNQGDAARFKKIFLIDLNEVGADGFLVKHELVDLLNVSDPNHLGANTSPEGKFTFPFQTIEDVEVINPWTIGVLDDNNFPFSSGRTPGQPDNNEFVLLALPKALDVPGGATSVPTRTGTSSTILKNFAAGNFDITDTVSTAPRPLIIGHRGIAGRRPEHTIEGYTLAARSGADFIEPDLVLTKDGVLIARHEPVLAAVKTDSAGNPLKNADGTYQIQERTTNVNEHPEFAGRLTTRVLDGTPVTGWWAQDFTLAEIKTLRAVERLPDLRPESNAFSGQFQIPTFEEVVQLSKQLSTELGRTVGIYPETKHPTFHEAAFGAQFGPHYLEREIVRILEKYNMNTPTSPVFIQSFEVSNLKYLNTIANVPLVQLYDEGDVKPYDFVVSGDPCTYGDLMKPSELAKIAEYADGIGPWKRLIKETAADEDHDGVPNELNTLIQDAPAAGLLVHAYTFRDESVFLLPEYGNDPRKEYQEFFCLGLDGLFTDFASTARPVADALYPFTPPDFLHGVANTH